MTCGGREQTCNDERLEEIVKDGRLAVYQL